MKTQDLVSVITIAAVGTILGYMGLNAVLGDPLDKTVSFDYLEFNAEEFYMPDGEMFNPAAINPTVDVYVGTCVDLDSNGVLDDLEKVACGEAVETKRDEVTTSADNNSSTGTTNTSTDTNANTNANANTSTSTNTNTNTNTDTNTSADTNTNNSGTTTNNSTNGGGNQNQ